MKHFFLILFFIFSVVIVFAQCPACSNPALQSSEKLEAGLDTLSKGTMRFTVNATNGFNYQGGHPNYLGLTQNKTIVSVPEHQHLVDLDFLRTEFSFEYTFKTNWSVWIRLPYDLKMQTASVEFGKNTTDEEKTAILRNRDIHHRSENYNGISDSRLLIAHRINGFLSKKGRLDVAFGVSVPIGKTEENPLTAKQAGVQHLHIQFGSGTFDPLAEFHYTLSLSKKVTAALFSINKISVYTNDKGYKGPFEGTSGIGVGYRLGQKWVSRITLANFVQTQAIWEGIKDPNSGLIAFNASFNLTYYVAKNFTITPGYRLPISQRTLQPGGDTFKYGPTFLLNASILINK